MEVKPNGLLKFLLLDEPLSEQIKLDEAISYLKQISDLVSEFRGSKRIFCNVGTENNEVINYSIYSLEGKNLTITLEDNDLTITLNGREEKSCEFLFPIVEIAKFNIYYNEIEFVFDNKKITFFWLKNNKKH